MAKTLKELAEQALAVQDAVNLVAVAQSFAEASVLLRGALKAVGLPNGTDDVARHAITTLWIDKLVQLNGHDGNGPLVSNSYLLCDELIKGIK